MYQLKELISVLGLGLRQVERKINFYQGVIRFIQRGGYSEWGCRWVTCQEEIKMICLVFGIARYSSGTVNNLSEMSGYRKIMCFATSRRVGAGIGQPIIIMDIEISKKGNFRIGKLRLNLVKTFTKIVEKFRKFRIIRRPIGILHREI